MAVALARGYTAGTMTGTHAMQFDQGSRFGRYEILAPIGSGGMGEVYRASDLRLGREVAIKVLSKRHDRDDDALARFEREARAVAALSHPNIVAIHDFAVQDGMPYTVTELLHGESLRERLERGPLPWRQVAELGVATAEGLATAHAKGIVHRDLKPENLFLTCDGRVKILDFGLAQPGQEARVSLRAHDASAPTIATAHDSGAVVGTIGYMSPEQARGLPVGTTSDIFSLGCVLYELVTGRRPFDRATPTDTLAAVLREPPALLSESGHQLPPELSRIVLHCLEKDPARRFQAARDLAFALQAVLNDSSADIVPQGRKNATRGKSVAVLPFANDSGDPDLDYLSDGIAETLINSLTQVPRLRVVPRAVSFRYKGRAIDPAALGVELNATTLVSGRMVVRGPTLSVQAEMTDVGTNAQLWGQRFTRPATDVFALQEELAAEIAAALRGRLTRSRAKKKPTATVAPPNPAAYEAYLRGRFEWNRWNADGFAKAIEHYERAVLQDASFAPAWAGLAETIGAAVYFGYASPEELPRLRRAAQRSVELDPSLADGHAVVGISALFYDWNFPEAERGLRHALSLNPHLAKVHVYYSLYLSSQGRCEEAVREARQAERLDPVSPLALRAVAWALIYAGRDEEALTQLHRILDVELGAGMVHGMLASIHELRGEYDAVFPHLAAWLASEGRSPELSERVRQAWEEGGERGYWQGRLEMLDRAQLGGPASLAYAYVHVQLGDRQKALEYLEDGVNQRLPAMVYIGVERWYRLLHGDPGFEALRQRVGVPTVPFPPVE